MSAKSLAGIALIALVVAGLAVWRSTRDAAPPTAAAATAGALPEVLDFGRGQCQACKEMKPVLEELARRHEGRVAVRVLDLAEPEAQALAEKHRVVLIPTQVLLDPDGTERFRHEGFIALADLEARMAELGWTRDR